MHQSAASWVAGVTITFVVCTVAIQLLIGMVLGSQDPFAMPWTPAMILGLILTLAGIMYEVHE